MPHHPALAPGRAAVITGAASGIGFAMAERCVALGMKVCMADVDEAALRAAVGLLAAKAANQADVFAILIDVSRREEVERLQDHAIDAFGEVSFLMNNAGREGGGTMFGGAERWEAILGANLWGVVNGVQVFGPKMVEQGRPCAIVNTGSKQGITTPPGDTAYNVSKAGVKVVTEALQHELRNIEGCQVTAHLLVPGFTFTGFTRARTSEKPPGACTPEQVIDFLLPAMARGDFYILCPDNDVTRAMDEKRIRWAAEDIIQNRPPLSRWHPDYKDAFATFMES
ncbi:MAG: SDR family NAD(P)-dependent oxidoreductase [Rhizobiales bacterium]|nr:SDR family NAD(P)-dependent oxidoreductase [Hyphomicrobiales bacterium]